MSLDLRTNKKKKSDQLKNDVIARFKEVEHLDGTDWQKFGAIAPKFKITQGYVAKIIKAHRNEQSDSQSN